MNFIVDTFDNVAPHFLDIEIHPEGLSIYCKDTNTGQRTHYNSYSITVIPHSATEHFGFLPLSTGLSIFEIKTSYKQNSKE